MPQWRQGLHYVEELGCDAHDCGYRCRLLNIMDLLKMRKYLLLQQELRGRRVDGEGVAVRQAGVGRVAALPRPRRQAAQLQLQLRPGRPTISTRNIYTIYNICT